MKAAVIVFPGSNCDRDLAVALRRAGARVSLIWHKDAHLPDGVDLVAIPGGFSFGDYLRCGAIAANSPICAAIVDHATRGGFVIGICNGFQILTETGLLPGVLMRNAGLKFICKPVDLAVETTDSHFTATYRAGQNVRYPIAHHDGNYQAAPETLRALNGEARVAFRYADNPNGSAEAIAGVLSKNRRVLGLMPHPERAAEVAHGCDDGARLFSALIGVTQDA